VGIVRALRARTSVDVSRVYGVGYSMGAIGLWDILARHPGLFSAAVLIAGDLDVAAASCLTSFPLWAIVGRRDEVVPPDNNRAFAGLVAEHGGLARLTEIASAGHDVWRTAFTYPPLWDWLFAQVSSPPM
jgi:predicted peptidase